MPKETTSELVHRTVTSIKSHRFIKTIESDVMFVYNEQSGIYVPQAESSLKQEIELMLQEQSTDFVVKEVINKIKRTTPASVDDFDCDENIAHVGNGLLDLTTLELEPHRREHLSLRKVSADYDPTADCPVFKHYLETTLEENDRVVVQQLLGFLLMNHYKYRRAFLFVGPTHTGKTTLMNAIISFLGTTNVSSISLQSLCDIGSYDTHDLVRMMANVHDDLSREDIKQTGRLKQLTGESRIRAREIYGTPFDFWNKAKLIYSCNEIPPAPHADEAYYGRWVIIPMLQQFAEGTTADDTLGEKLSSPAELSGILNFALDGVKLLNLMHGFSYPTDAETNRTRYLAYSGDPIARFVSECVIFDNKEIEPKATVYAYYTQFCELCGTAPVDDISFFIRVSHYLDKRVSDCRPTEVNRQMAYRGMKVKLPKTTRPKGRFEYRAVSIRPSDFLEQEG